MSVCIPQVLLWFLIIKVVILWAELELSFFSGRKMRKRETERERKREILKHNPIRLDTSGTRLRYSSINE